MAEWNQREVEVQRLTYTWDERHFDVIDTRPRAGKKVQWKRCRHCGRGLTAQKKPSDRHHLGASTGGFRVFRLLLLLCLADRIAPVVESN